MIYTIHYYYYYYIQYGILLLHIYILYTYKRRQAASAAAANLQPIKGAEVKHNSISIKSRHTAAASGKPKLQQFTN